MRRIGWIIAATVSLSAWASELHLAPIFTDNLVVQCDMPVPVWGTAEPNAKVTVKLGEQSAETIAAADGKWKVVLKALPAGGPLEMTVAASQTITLHNILVGEVWFCAGQSNMELPVNQSANGAAEAAKADFTQIRLFYRSKNPTAKQYAPRKTDDAWQICTPATVAGFSAVAFYFGRDLHQTLNVPVGLIECDYGGSLIEAWMDMKTLESVPEARPIVDKWNKTVMANWPATLEKYHVAVDKWTADSEKARAAGKPAPPEPRTPFGPGFHIYALSSAWNGMVEPLIPAAIRGVLWYQGESSRGKAYAYRTMFPAMIAAWRKAWGEGDFPFVFVQVPGFKNNKPIDAAHPDRSQWAEIREAQACGLSSPNTAMVVTLDLGDGGIHPKNKLDVGHRASESALALVYGKHVVCTGPAFDSYTIESDGKVRIQLKGGGGLTARNGEPLKGFIIAGEDKEFVPADAVIDNGSVVVSSAKVAKPAAVRYAWEDNPECNLFGKNGLPCAPFRTDNWPGETWPK